MCGILVLATSQTQKNLTLFDKNLTLIKHRGPDDKQIQEIDGAGLMGFHRLSIMDLTNHGRQPFASTNLKNYLVCNGEIYNYLDLKKELPHFSFQSQSDCEVLLPLYEKWGIKKLCDNLDAEFAFVIWDQGKKKFLAARDALGIRPLFYGITREKTYAFSSEAKSLRSYCEKILPFPPGHYFDGKDFHCFLDYGTVSLTKITDLSEIYQGINSFLTAAVKKRLQSDAEVGFLLSGGLDSSLVCAIAQKSQKKPLQTFSIGMTTDAIDSKYAEEVAKFIGAKHTSVTMTTEEVIQSLDEVIFHLETWDITSIRASIGMYLVSKYIHKNTPIKVLLTGEVSDELFGYKYTDFAPNAEEFQNEAIKRVRELYLYDVLRADRCIAAHSLEARVPFSDKFFVQFVMSIDPIKKLNTHNMGKFLLREAFKNDHILPESILWREKAAFSDAVGHSMVDELKAYAEKNISDAELLQAHTLFPFCTPFTKESLLYRKIFAKHYPNQDHLIKAFWMPNQNWNNCKVNDPSARVLPNYGKSGH